MSEVNYDHLTTSQIRRLCLDNSWTIAPGDKRQRSTWVATIKAAKVITPTPTPTPTLSTITLPNSKPLEHPPVNLSPVDNPPTNLDNVSRATDLPLSKLTKVSSTAVLDAPTIELNQPISAKVIGLSLILMLGAAIALAFFFLNLSIKISSQVWHYLTTLATTNSIDRQLIFNTPPPNGVPCN